MIEKLNTWYEGLPLRQRYLVMAGIGAILLTGITLFISPEQQPVTSIVPSAVKSKPAESQPAMPGGYTAHQTMRDPFAPPPGFGKPEKSVVAPQAGNQPISAMQASAPMPAVTPAALPQLMGVVSGGDRQMAIINYNNISRSYYPGQDIGPYQLIKVDANSVIVQGPGGRQALALGR
jgi:hypothetical protein